ncbi:MAG: hypothetical protein ACXWAC_12400 [Usitatibacter sp.]
MAKRLARKKSQRSPDRVRAKVAGAPNRKRKVARASASLSPRQARDEDKSFAVSEEIDNQLRSDGHTYNLNDIMGADLHYDINSITVFLRGVQLRLAARNPAYDFQFDSAFAIRALGLSVGELNGEVDARTVRMATSVTRKVSKKSKKAT